MAKLNIPSSVEDPDYRYTMPSLVSRKEGRGNGSKTGIHNMGEVARALNRDPVYLTKFLGYELVSQASYTNKDKEGERVVIRGHHEAHVLQAQVDKFIDKYVLCPKCRYPEIDMVVSKKGLVVAMCKACHWSGELDNNHKLATYIQKNPPKSGIGFERPAQKQETIQDNSGSDVVKEKKDKKEKKEKKSKIEQDTSDGDVVKEKKDKKEKKEKKSKTDCVEGMKKTKVMVEDNSDGDVVNERKDKKEKKEKESETEGGDSMEMSKVKKEKKDMKEENESGDLTHNDEVVSRVVNDIMELMRRDKDMLTPDKLMEEVRVQQLTQCFDDKLRMFVVVAALFPNGSLDKDGVETKRLFLKASIDLGKLSFPTWIWGFQAYLAVHPSAKKTFAMTLKGLYDVDIAQEEDILAYYRNQQSSPEFLSTQRAVQPLLNWLEMEEDDSDSD